MMSLHPKNRSCPETSLDMTVALAPFECAQGNGLSGMRR